MPPRQGACAPRAAKPAPRPRLITDITVEHGPVDLLGRIFLLADTAARERGVTLSFGSFEELIRVNEKNRASWPRITTMYDQRYCPQGLAADRAFCIMGRNTSGEVVTTHAARILSGKKNFLKMERCGPMASPFPEEIERPGGKMGTGLHHT